MMAVLPASFSPTEAVDPLQGHAEALLALTETAKVFDFETRNIHGYPPDRSGMLPSGRLASSCTALSYVRLLDVVPFTVQFSARAGRILLIPITEQDALCTPHVIEAERPSTE